MSVSRNVTTPEGSGRGRRVGRRAQPEDLEVDRLGLGRGVDPELLDERRPAPLPDPQRLGPLARGGERPHQLAVRGLLGVVERQRVAGGLDRPTVGAGSPVGRRRAPARPAPGGPRTIARWRSTHSQSSARNPRHGDLLRERGPPRAPRRRRRRRRRPRRPPPRPPARRGRPWCRAGAPGGTSRRSTRWRRRRRGRPPAAAGGGGRSPRSATPTRSRAAGRATAGRRAPPVAPLVAARRAGTRRPADPADRPRARRGAAGRRPPAPTPHIPAP